MSEDLQWHPTSNAKLGVVIWEYKRGSYPFLSLDFGETVQILEENGGWYRGCAIANKQKKGIFPASHVHLKPSNVKNPGPSEVVTSKDDPIVAEIGSALHEWSDCWKKLYSQCERSAFLELFNKMRDLVEWRRQVFTQSLTQDEMRELKQRITSAIDSVNKELKLDVVPRDENGRIINPKDISIIRLYKVMRSQEEKHPTGHGTIGPGSAPMKASSGDFNIWLKLDLLMLQLRHPVEIVITVYDRRLMQHVSEPYREVLSEKGLPVDEQKIGCTYALFTDFDKNDRTNRDLYLVCRVIKLCNEVEKGRKFYSEVRLPYGVGVYPLGDVLRGMYDDHEEGKTFHNLQINQSIQKFSSDFAKLQDYVIDNDRTAYTPPQEKGSGLFGAVKILNGSLEKACADYPLQIKKNTAICRKTVFSDAIKSEVDRHDVYIDLVSGFFDKGTKTADKNVEVQVSVVDETGKIVEGLVSGGQGGSPTSIYKTVIFYHTAQCHFVDSIRVHVPPQCMDKYCVKFVCGHMSAGSRPKFDSHALGYIRLVTKDGTAIPDGLHDLQLYSYKEAICNARYLKESCKATGDTPTSPVQLVPKDSLKIKTTTCSTHLTQNADLLALLKWQNHKSRLSQVLAGVKKIYGDEILKFLTSSLDAVFNILEEVSHDEADLAFQALVYVLSTILERRFLQHRGLLDKYIVNSFSRPQVYPKLMEKLKASFGEVMLPGQERKLDNDTLVKSMKAAEYLVKFIVKSRQQYADQTRGRGKEVFLRDIRDMLVTFFEMIKFQFPSDDVVAPRSQALALTLFPTTLKDLLMVVHRQLLSDTIADFLFKLSPARLPGFKTTFLQSLVSSELFANQESRVKLLPAVLRQLTTHILNMDEHMRLCLEVLLEIISCVYDQNPDSAAEEVKILVVHSLQTLYTVYKTMKEEAEAAKTTIPFRQSAVVVCLLGVLQMMAQAHFRWCIAKPEPDSEADSTPSEPKFKSFIHQSFYIFHDMTARTIFPADWSVMFLLMNSILTHTTHHIMDLISADMLGSKESQGSMSFNHSLWRNFFQFAVSFCVQDSLQLEKFTDSKSSRVLKWYGDMRVTMNDNMVSYWKQLGVLRVRFIPEMVGPFLQVSLLPHPGLRKRTIPLFYDMMDIHRKNGFRVLELELTEKLDTFITQGHGDIEFKKSLEDVLGKRCKENADMVSRGGPEFVSNLSKLLERLFDFRSVAVVEQEVTNDLRMHVMFNLLNFYKELGREEMYIRYIYRLAEMQESSGAFVEAGFTLLLHSRLLQWANDRMAEEGPYPAQTCAERKNALFQSIVDLFDKGKLWETGIELCQELIQHAASIYDYRSLCQLHLRISKLYEKILSEIRADPQYFRVCFYGGFPPFFKDKTFVFRGLEYEHLSSFNERLSTIFRRAKFMKTLDPPDAEIRGSTDQYVQSCVVTPVSDKLAKFAGTDVNEQVLKYHRNNNVKRFTLKRGFHKGPKDKSNEFVSLFLECTTYTTADSFPGIMRWFEVVATDVTELNPVENGIETVSDNIVALQSLINKYNQDQTGSTNPLTMKLQGILEAAVGGGLKNYDVFFTKEYQQSHADYVKATETLKDKMVALCNVSGQALALHGRVCPTTIRELHEHIELKYREFRKKYGSHNDEDPYEPLKQTPGGAAGGAGGGGPATTDQQATASFDQPPPVPVSSRPTSIAFDDSSSNNSLNLATTPGEPDTPPPLPVKKRPARSYTFAVSNSDSSGGANNHQPNRGSSISVPTPPRAHNGPVAEVSAIKEDTIEEDKTDL